ncbi:MAG: class II aldolase/adducin family protein [Acidobacteria bacterium]|nr:class II aldolase/adducin family protein [Acidobacteriota bacterium]
MTHTYRRLPLKLLRQFRTTGRDLSEAGLVSSNSGNISARCRGGIVITRHDSTLAHLEEDDLIEVATGESHPLASVELIVHQAIYQTTPALAIVHAHPPSAVALSLALTTDRIEVVDPASTLLGIVPIIEANAVSGSQALANAMRDALRQSGIALVRGHGSFAVGETLAEACEWTRLLEETCRALLSKDRSSEERDVR